MGAGHEGFILAISLLLFFWMFEGRMEIKKVAVIGAGTMGIGIAYLCAIYWRRWLKRVVLA